MMTVDTWNSLNEYEYYVAPKADVQTKCYFDYAYHTPRARLQLTRAAQMVKVAR